MQLMQVLHMTQSASVAILLVLLARLVLKRAPKIFSYALWAVVLFRLLCPFSFQSPVSVMPDMEPMVQETVTTEPSEVYVVENQDVSLHPEPTSARTWNIREVIWLTGMAGMAVYAGISYIRLRRKLVTASWLRDNIYLADDIPTPFVLGVLRPKIYLPSDLGEQTYMVLHEQHHIRRGDHLFKLLGFAALCIHWFNPLVWLAFVLAGKDMEMSCDEAVIRKLGDEVRADYAEALLRLSTGKPMLAVLAFGEDDPKGRIRNLARWKKPVLWVVAASLLICAVLAVCLMTDPVQEPPMVGNTYVSEQCLFMHPLSSYGAFGGDSGYTYTFQAHGLEIVHRHTGAREVLPVGQWRWREFPFTDEEWAALYVMALQPAEQINSLYDEILYQPLTEKQFLLKADGDLWIVELKENPQMGVYLWSIYTLVPEETTGSAQWEYAPMLSSRSPVFRFAFDMDYTEVSAVCTQSLLTEGQETAHNMVYPQGSALCWSPRNKDGSLVNEAEIHFTIQKEDSHVNHGVLYITSTSGQFGRRVYTAKLVGVGLHLLQNPEQEGGVVAMAP